MHQGINVTFGAGKTLDVSFHPVCWNSAIFEDMQEQACAEPCMTVIAKFAEIRDLADFPEKRRRTFSFGDLPNFRVQNQGLKGHNVRRNAACH
ncbi:hypothetical protein AA0229_2540 [Gluconobacter cerinus NRIC 0229]|nr:hypothetical protein AA0229_2540 [Gluconobacter cerinus NRIC 0229]